MTPVAESRVSFETAARQATSSVPVVAPGTSIDELRRWLAGRRFECAGHIVVCDAGRFLGVARVEDVLAADADLSLAEVMDPEPPVVGPGVDQERAAWRAVSNRQAALSVVDELGHFVGLIPPHRLLAVMLSEHEEDLSRLGGFTRSAAVARETSQEPVERRFRHRVPWLLVGLVGALLAADIVGWFEAALEEQVMLAFFVPGIVYLADAVGTQTETIVVRGLSVGVTLRSMVRRELLAGLAIGIALALVATPVVWWRWGDADVALSVGLAIFAASSTATLAAMGLPWLMDSLDVDPAFGSGPLATVVQDLLSILIYFGIAVTIIG